MVGQVDSTLPRAMFTSRVRDFHVPRSFLVCVLSLWLTLSTAQALDPNKRLIQYGHSAWRVQDGFFPNTPYWISQTKDGYLWVAGASGALRFDGVRLLLGQLRSLLDQFSTLSVCERENFGLPLEPSSL